MARAPYLSRCEGGRYCLQVRFGRMAAELYGRSRLGTICTVCREAMLRT